LVILLEADSSFGALFDTVFPFAVSFATVYVTRTVTNVTPLSDDQR
jgi:hypothetical protein